MMLSVMGPPSPLKPSEPRSMMDHVTQRCKLHSMMLSVVGPPSPLRLLVTLCLTGCLDSLLKQFDPPLRLPTRRASPLTLPAHYCSPRSLHQYVQYAQHFSPDRQRNQRHVKVSARAVRENGATYLSRIDRSADRRRRSNLRWQNHALYQIRWHTRDPDSRCPTVILGWNCPGMMQISP